MTKLRIYTDTSVIGGCLDREFADDSKRLMKLATDRKIVLLISQIVLDELAAAPGHVRNILSSLPIEAIQYVPLTPQVIKLRDTYLAARIVGRKWLGDATHVAAASVAGADAIVSWNFRHIVRLDRINAYNEVNERLGYRRLTIVTPLEVTRDVKDPD